MKKTYERPALNKVDIRNEETIADTCWGLTETHNNQKTRYYDVTGNGILSFNVKNTNGSCDSPDAYNIKYIFANENTSTVDTVDLYKYFTKDEATKMEAELETALSSKGGNNGQPYKGLDADFPTAPVPDSK